MRKPMRASRPLARSGLNIVRKDSMIEVALIGSVGSCAGERAAHLPRVCTIGSAS
jgi:hypothetical protein